MDTEQSVSPMGADTANSLVTGFDFEQIPEIKYRHSLIAMLMLRDSFRDQRQRGVAYEAILQVAFRAWGWNVEKTVQELDRLKKVFEDNAPYQAVFRFDPEGIAQSHTEPPWEASAKAP